VKMQFLVTWYICWRHETAACGCMQQLLISGVFATLRRPVWTSSRQHPREMSTRLFSSRRWRMVHVSELATYHPDLW